MNSDLPFSLRIEAEKALSKLLPEKWERYFGKPDSSQSEVVLRLREDVTLGDKEYAAGWSMRLLNGIRQAVFAPKGKAYFSLTYGLSGNEVTVCVRKALDSFVRTGVLYGMLMALHPICVGMHGVTLICGDQAVILSAPSGTGKTTLSRLLEEHAGARVINGDFSLLSLSVNGVIFEPTPFCGTSRICLNERIRIDRVVFLSQSDGNIWKDLDGRQAALQFLSNAFIPTFDGLLQQSVQINVMRMLPLVKVNSFAFAPTREAALIFLDMIAFPKRS